MDRNYDPDNKWGMPWLALESVTFFDLPRQKDNQSDVECDSM